LLKAGFEVDAKIRAGGAIKQVVRIAIAAVRLELDEGHLIIRRLEVAPDYR
jgi:hypothetical protein